MKNQYEKIKIEIFMFQDEDIVTFSSSGVVEEGGDETLYPIPDSWLNG